LNKEFTSLKELPFIKKLQNNYNFKHKNLSDEELTNEFELAVNEQNIDIRHKTMHFFADMISLIKPSYKSQIELNAETTSVRDTFQSILATTRSQALSLSF